MLNKLKTIKISSHLNQRLAMLTTIMLIIVIGYTIFSYIHKYISNSHPLADILNSVNSPTDQILSIDTDAYASVSRLHLFGETKISRNINPAKSHPIPDTRSIIKLQGILYTPNKEDALAIISSPNGKYYVIKKGDNILQNIKIIDILDDRVILSRDGNLEPLQLKREAAIIQLSQADTADSNRVVISTRILQQITQTLALYETDPDKFRKMVRIQKVSDNNKVRGYRISYSDRRLMKVLGMRPHDIIVKLNDVVITDENTPTRLIDEIKNKNDINLAVLRNGELRDIKIKFK